ncbi:hypothetical protein BD769DRAFT_1384258 [Suillus cothurnatus]|nr:hypothetical protein BD769DRAFT_1384258 [Suillus cothurnatus]
MDNILQQILESKILDWDPHGSRILGTTGHAVGESYEDGVNTDANIAALSTAIDRCNIACEDEYEAEEQKPKSKILDWDPHGSYTLGTDEHAVEGVYEDGVNTDINICGEVRDEVETKKRKPGHPKKQAMQICSKLFPTLPTDASSHKLQNTNARRIRATSSPVVQPNGGVVRHAMTDIALESTIYEEEQQVQKGDDDGSNADEILQQVITSGILKWDPQGSFVAKHVANDSLDLNWDRRKKSTGIDDRSNTQLKDHLIHPKMRCRCGQPARRAATLRKRGKKPVSINPTSPPYQLGNNHNTRPIIRATSNPVEENQQIMAYDVVDDNNNNNNGPCTEEGELDTYLSANKQSRGCPKKRIIGAKLNASKNQVIHQSNFNAHESDHSDNEYKHIQYPCSPALSAGSIPDDEYRPSPLPEAAVGSPSPERQADPSAECTEDEIAVRAMAKPVVWLSAWQYTTHVLGRYITSDAIKAGRKNPHDWNQWKGPEYWRHIAALHHWDAGDVTDISVTCLDWIQNGVDCGPIACSVLEQFINTGFDENNHIPSFPVPCRITYYNNFGINVHGLVVINIASLEEDAKWLRTHGCIHVKRERVDVLDEDKREKWRNISRNEEQSYSRGNEAALPENLSGYDQCLAKDWDVIFFLNMDDLFQMKTINSDIKISSWTTRVNQGMQKLDENTSGNTSCGSLTKLDVLKNEKSTSKSVTTATDTEMLRVVMAAVELNGYTIPLYNQQKEEAAGFCYGHNL